MKDDSYYMNIAYNEAKKAYKKNEIPVGAVIVSMTSGKIISKAHNLRDSSFVVTKHAEIIAIEKANKKIKNWRLNDCILYTTLKPCNMCFSVIKNCKLRKVIYAANSNSEEIKLQVEIKQIEKVELVEKSSRIIQKMFENLRKK